MNIFMFDGLTENLTRGDWSLDRDHRFAHIIQCNIVTPPSSSF